MVHKLYLITLFELTLLKKQLKSYDNLVSNLLTFRECFNILCRSSQRKTVGYPFGVQSKEEMQSTSKNLFKRHIYTI